MDYQLYKEQLISLIDQYPNITSGKERLAISRENSFTVISKSSTPLEFGNHKMAYEYFELNPIKLNKVISILPVEIFAWDEVNRELKTIFVKGYNLEIILSRVFGEARSFFIGLISQFFSLLKWLGFLWGDLAPRNIIIDERFEYIRFCDFERPLDIINREIGDSEFDFYLGNYALEEFCSFLFHEEQSIIFPKYTVEHLETLMKIERITSKRKLALLQTLYGIKMAYSIQQIKKSEAMIINAVTPFWINGSAFFPMIHLDKIMLNQPKHLYAELVLELSTLTDEKKYERFLSFSNL